MVISAIRTVIIYLTLLFVLRIMGKRQIGNMQPHELVVTIIIAELGVVSMENTEIPLLAVLVPVMVLFLMQFSISYITFKNTKVNEIINGRPLLVVRHGKFQERTLRDALISVNEILEQMRLSGIKDIKNVSYAILETTGQLSVFVKEEEEAPSAKVLGLEVSTSKLPVPIILSGTWQRAEIRAAKLNPENLRNALKNRGFSDIKSIYYAEVDEDGHLHIQAKGDR